MRQPNRPQRLPTDLPPLTDATAAEVIEEGSPPMAFRVFNADFMEVLHFVDGDNVFVLIFGGIFAAFRSINSSEETITSKFVTRADFNFNFNFNFGIRDCTTIVYVRPSYRLRSATASEASKICSFL